MNEHDQIPYWLPKEILDKQRAELLARMSPEVREHLIEGQRRLDAIIAARGPQQSAVPLRHMTMDEYAVYLLDPESWNAEMQQRIHASLPADVRERINVRKQVLGAMKNARYN